MRLVQFADPASETQHLGLVEGEEVVDLSQGTGAPQSVHDLYYGAGGDEIGLEAAARQALSRAGESRRVSLAELMEGRGGEPHLLKPVSGPRDNPHALKVWLAGVTHEDSAKLREIESKQATGDAVNVYDQKYRETAAGGRPELFPRSIPMRSSATARC